AGELLTRELNHRSKNLLNVVMAVSTMTGRQSENFEEFNTKFQERLLALARCQDDLTRHAWQSVPITAILQSQVSPLAGDRLRMKGDELSISVDQVQAVSMIFHELATNAAKYGAFSASSGQVEICWTEPAHT